MAANNVNSNTNRNNSTNLGNTANNKRNGNSNNSRNANSNNSQNRNSNGTSLTDRFSNTFNSAKSFFSGSNNTSKNNVGKNNVKNTAKNNAKGVSKNSSTIFIIIALILLVIILAVAGYFIYRHMKSSAASELVTKQFIPYIHDASIDKRISKGTIPKSSDGNEYNINFWIYVNDYSVRKEEDKCILYRGDNTIGQLNNAQVGTNTGNSNINCNPSMWLLRNVNTLRIIVGLQTNYSQSGCNDREQAGACQSGAQNVDVCDIENFPLQRWVSINLTMRNNVVDIFFDGELKKSFVLRGFPVLADNDMLVCPDGGFNGYISNMKYSNKALSVESIKSMYKSGPTL